MPPDPYRLRPTDLPTPFTAEEIRRGCSPGRTVRSLVIQPDGDPYVSVTRFVAGDADGGDQEYWRETPDGVRLTPTRQSRSTWLEFQGHASMPAANTRITEEDIEIPAGQYACLRYTRVDGDRVSTFWFARSAPGMPLAFEERVDGVLVFSSTAIEDTNGAAVGG